MNIERLITMILRQATRRLVHRGVDAGIDLAAGRGRKTDEMTPEERQRAAEAKQMAKRARQAARLTRRMR